MEKRRRDQVRSPRERLRSRLRECEPGGEAGRTEEQKEKVRGSQSHSAMLGTKATLAARSLTQPGVAFGPHRFWP